MKFKYLSNKITLFSENVKNILGSFWKIISRYDLTASTLKDMSRLTDITAQLVEDFCWNCFYELMRQFLDIFCAQRQVVYANVIYQTGEKTARIKHLASTDIQAAIRRFKRILSGCIFGDFCAIHIESPVRTVPGKADMVPLAVGNYGIGYQRLREKPAGGRRDQAGHEFTAYRFRTQPCLA